MGRVYNTSLQSEAEALPFISISSWDAVLYPAPALGFVDYALAWGREVILPDVIRYSIEGDCDCLGWRIFMAPDIRKIVKDGYEQGDYEGKFRVVATLNSFETTFLEKLTSRVPPGASILDFGCGIGIPFDKYLVEQGFQVTGIDVCHKHIQQAICNVPGATFIEADFSRYNFKRNDFGAIVAFYSIFHLPREEHHAIFSLMQKLLRPGGVILITLGARAGEGIDEDWAGSQMAWSSYDPASYEKQLSDAGFTVLETAFEGAPSDQEYHFWVLAQKAGSP